MILASFPNCKNYSDCIFDLWRRLTTLGRRIFSCCYSINPYYLIINQRAKSNIKEVFKSDILDYLLLYLYEHLNNFIINLVMLFQTKTSTNNNRSKTPTKNSSFLNSTPKIIKKEGSKIDTNYK